MSHQSAWLAGLMAASIVLTLPVSGQEAKTEARLYKEAPRRKLTVFYPDDWKPTDRRPALVIFRCRIPYQREFFRQRGMVVIEPQTAPVNSGSLPGLSLEEIAKLPKPRDQVADTKSAIRFIRAEAESFGIDPAKIVATGTSGGGDLALQAHLNQAFVDPNDDLSVSARPDALVLYCPAFDGIDLWFVKRDELAKRTREEAPDFLPWLDQFVSGLDTEYAQPRDHRAVLIERAKTLGEEKGAAPEAIRAFQAVLEMFNERDWQLLHPVEDALEMSASRLLRKGQALPPTLILIGDRDHLRKAQLAFLARARSLEIEFQLEEYSGGGHSFMTQPAFEGPSTEDVAAFLESVGMLSPMAP